MRLYDLALVCRSKNAGPFQVTIDLMFDDEAAYRRVLSSLYLQLLYVYSCRLFFLKWQALIVLILSLPVCLQVWAQYALHYSLLSVFWKVGHRVSDFLLLSYGFWEFKQIKKEKH